MIVTLLVAWVVMTLSILPFALIWNAIEVRRFRKRLEEMPSSAYLEECVTHVDRVVQKLKDLL